MNRTQGVILDKLLFSLIGMIITFIGVYLFMSRKLDQTNIADKLRHEKRKSPKITATKFELEKKRIKSELYELFVNLTIEEQISWIEELKNLHENPQQNSDAS